MAAADGRLAGFWCRVFGSGYDGGPTVGPGGRGSTGPRSAFPARRGGFGLIRWGAGRENHHPDLASSVNTPANRQWVQAAKLKKGEHLKTAGGATAIADGGSTPKVHDGWMWDLAVPATMIMISTWLQGPRWYSSIMLVGRVLRPRAT